GSYSLTIKGKEMAEEYSEKMMRLITGYQFLKKQVLSPIFSFLIHSFLGLLKLFGFMITGSISLLSDGLDSAMDGFSAIIVGVAMRIDKEKQATYLLLVLMVITGLGVLISSIDRILHPIALKEETLAIIIAVISIILVGLLYVYQRYSGYTNRSLAILAQSEDSKNHILNAALVFAVMFASSVGILILDGIVGCFISLIILQGAYEIFQDQRAASNGESVNLDKYRLTAIRKYDNAQIQILNLWILNKLNNGLTDYSDLEQSFEEDFGPLIINLPEERLYTWKSSQTKQILKKQFETMLHSGYLREEQNMIYENILQLSYSVTEKGVKKLLDNVFSSKSGKKSPITHEFAHLIIRTV
ncbi:MAG: cation diffusion facilitator family transporter, partial [Candidatus Kariarchaeaceae archaeon]